MGVEYCHDLIPRPNSFSPSPQQLELFIEALARENWITVPGSDVLIRMAAIDDMLFQDADEVWAQITRPTGFELVPFPLTQDWFESRKAGDLKLGIPIEHADRIGVKLPLISDLGLPDDPYYEVQLHSSVEFVHHVSELIEPAEAVCECGASVEHDVDDEVFFASRIRVQCPTCSQSFDPSFLEVVVRDGWTGKHSVVLGGVIYRFAVVIDCGKCIPKRKRNPIKANPELVNLCQSVFGQDFYEVGDIY